MGDLERGRDKVVFPDLAERDEPRVLGVRGGERIPADMLAEDIDQDVVPSDLSPFELDEVADVDDMQGPYLDPGLFQSLADRCGFDRLAGLQRSARHAPSTLVRFGSAFHEEDLTNLDHDGANRRDRLLWELAPR